MIRSATPCLLVLLLAATTRADEPTSPVFEKDLDAAFASARESGKPVLLYVHDSV